VIGIISYLSNRGIGTMAHDLRKQLGIERQLVIPDGGWPFISEWMIQEEFYLHQWTVQREDLEAWKQTDDIDAVISIETGFGDNTFRWAKELGMRTTLITMWESFNPHMSAYRNVDLYVCPSFRTYQEVPFDNKVFLPYPVDTDEILFKERSGPARVFVHNAGSGGINGRKGTREAILGFLKADIPETQLLVRTQMPDFFNEIRGWLKSDVALDDPRITLSCENVPDRADLYEDGDVLIYVSKYDGHSLVGIEGMCAGMPVITTDAEPMNELFQQGYPLLVRVNERKPAGTVNPHCLANIVDIDDLADKIRYCATHDMAEISRSNRRIVELEHSWSALKDRWKQKLGL